MNATITPASPKSISYLASLTNVDKTDDNYPEWALAMEENGQAYVSAAIKAALASQPAKKAPEPKVSKGEWHVVEGAFYLVAQSQNTGNLYAKKRKVEGGFDFAKGMMFKLSSATKVSVENLTEIQNFGKLYERCLFCNLPLDQPESITAGYGKICAENQGLPWN